MDNFRQPRSSRKALDGFINSSSSARKPRIRTPLTTRPNLSSQTLRSSGRTIGDFRRPEGYHAANQQIANPSTTARRAPDLNPLRTATGNGIEPPVNPPAKRGKRRKDKKPRDWKRIRKISLISGLATFLLIILIGGFLFTKGYFKVHSVFKGGGGSVALQNNVDPSLLKGEGDGRVNILLMGRGGEGHSGADLTDTILVASIDPINYKTDLVSIPRDLWVKTPYGSSKINAVYAYAKQRATAKHSSKKDAEAAGIKAIQDEVGSILGINIHYYGMVDFKAFQDAVNTVGGVDINVTKETAVSEHLWDESTRKPYYLNVQPGMQHFDGQRALFYARSRHTSPRGDFDRAERQRLLIEALTKKIASAGTYTNPVKVSELMDNFGSHVATDMSVNDAIRLMKIGKKIGSNFNSVDLALASKPLVKTGMISGQSIVQPVAGLNDYSQIQALIRSTFKDGYIVKENAKITVLNGTVSPGLAGSKADQLRSYGYNVTTVDSAPTKDYQNTVIVDLTKSNKKPYTRNYLEKRFGTKATTKLPDKAIVAGNADFVIILGSNETTNL